MGLPVKVFAPFSWTDTEGVGGAAEGAKLAEEGRGGSWEEEEGENGRSGKRTLEREVLEESEVVFKVSAEEEEVRRKESGEGGEVKSGEREDK